MSSCPDEAVRVAECLEALAGPLGGWIDTTNPGGSSSAPTTED